ncbi:histidine kinase [Streptomyces sp. MST-110588]|uniref:sensor histidine kinase n=1 Tax=Streptomyces sp. MST-110588 TaxID=2833628 RepID=UPI001F5D872A|nr:histidine kinase [Streptomyces sp. MST-110588]UNO39086.1 two-component sensor histidine kinase [Streptomyces sp. MST-110588]
MSVTSGMTRRDGALAVAAAAVGAAVAAVLAVTYGTSPFATAPTLAAVAFAIWAVGSRPRSRQRLARPLTLIAALSLVTTFCTPALAATVGAHWKLAEAGMLLVLLVAVVRHAPVRQAVTAVLAVGAAVSLWSLPLMKPRSALELAGAGAFWALPVLGAALLGGYPRYMEYRGRQLVTEARRTQRLDLARDLHDFVAHDISGIVVQAQAAHFLAASDPQQAVPALQRIEKAGLNALASMDRMVRTLHDADDANVADDAGEAGLSGDAERTDTYAAAGAATGAHTNGGAAGTPGAVGGSTAAAKVEPLPGIGQLPGLIERFSDAGATGARLDMAPDVVDALSRDAGSTAYRVVIEALTNVRRHAPGAARVDVVLSRIRTPEGTAAVEVRIRNDAGTAAGAPAGTGLLASARRKRDGHGGRGLRGLRERVRVVGGDLTAGPYEGGWQVVAVLPGPEGVLPGPGAVLPRSSARTPTRKGS